MECVSGLLFYEGISATFSTFTYEILIIFGHSIKFTNIHKVFHKKDIFINKIVGLIHTKDILEI